MERVGLLFIPSSGDNAHDLSTVLYCVRILKLSILHCIIKVACARTHHLGSSFCEVNPIKRKLHKTNLLFSRAMAKVINGLTGSNRIQQGKKSRELLRSAKEICIKTMKISSNAFSLENWVNAKSKLVPQEFISGVVNIRQIFY